MMNLVVLFRWCVALVLCLAGTLKASRTSDSFSECLVNRSNLSEVLLTQIRDADLVFTGKIVSEIQIDPNGKHIEFDAKIKRIILSPVTQVAGVVHVYGPNPTKCRLRRFDSGFFVTKFRNGSVELIGDLIKLTLGHLDLFNRIIKESCGNTKCPWGFECVAGKGGKALCLCSASCSIPGAPIGNQLLLNSISTSVCGSDGRTYHNECALRRTACRQKSSNQTQPHPAIPERLRRRHVGPCPPPPRPIPSELTATTVGPNSTTPKPEASTIRQSLKLAFELPDPCREKKCQWGEQCIVHSDGRIASCKCPTDCPSYGDHVASRPVCGSDGRDYKDKCELQKYACETKANITVKFEGKCDPCAEMICPPPEICQLDHQRNAVCRCGDTCSLEFTPVCGSDGKTYSNECSLRQEACRSRKSLRIVYRRKCNAGVNPCVGVRCEHGEECAINKYGIARCECPPDCEPVMRPICSKDGRTFISMCELRRAACHARTTIEVAHSGMCDKTGPCSDHSCQWGGHCIEHNGIAQCQCPTCPTDFQPVCASDGISYGNECKLRLEACTHHRDIRLLYHGPCNGCENKKCEFYANCESDNMSEAQCVCPGPCDNEQESSGVVCGTDGISYDSECDLKEKSCNNKQNVQIAYKGHCDMCKEVECKFGEHCRAGECVCPTDCSNIGVEPICASNMITYANECELKKVSCLLPADAQPLSVIFYGECRERFAIVSDSDTQTTPSISLGISGGPLFATMDDISSNGLVESKREACRDIHCDFEATCELGPDNFPRCTCRFDCTTPSIITNSKPVCASDFRLYPSTCAMKMEACQRQEELRLRPLELCQGMEVKPCNGDKPLTHPNTGQELDCGNGPNRQDCPSDSYCHQTTRFAKCCRKVASVTTKSCEDSWFGCCPDGKTPSQGVDHAGCPSQCNCHRLGSFDDTCDPETGQCHCRPGVGGLKCDRCEPGYWGLPKISSGHHGCLPCGCSTFGSVREDCEQMTGRCVCKPDIQGQKCTICTSHDKILSANGCTAVDRTTPPPSSCKELNCHFGAICTDRRGLAICECHSECDNEAPGSQQIVCGSDGQTYESECQLRLVACRHQKDIVVYAFGPCSEEMFPGNEWPIGRYTAMQFTQAGEIHSPLSKSTRHLLTPDSRYFYMRHSPSTGRWDATPEHIITGINFNVHAAYRPTPATVRVLTALIGDLCSNHTDCLIINSMCVEGACICKTGYVETSDRQECLGNSIPVTSTEELRACFSSPCHGDSTCIDLPGSTFTCVCSANFTGHLCDVEINTNYYVTPAFSGTSFIRLKTIKAFHKLNIEVEFKSYTDNGVIIYNQQKSDGSGDFVSLALVNGHIEFRYNLGNGIVRVVSLKKIQKSKYHNVVIKTYHRDGILKLDDGDEVAGFSKGKLRSLDLKEEAFVGYVPSNYSRVASNIGTPKGLIGCVRKLRINHQTIELHPSQDEFVLGMNGITECAAMSPLCSHAALSENSSLEIYTNCESYLLHPCANQPCLHGGTCSISGSHFQCRCSVGWTGTTCQVAATSKNNVLPNSIFVPEFNGSSYIQFPRLSGVKKTTSIELWIRPISSNGLLLYAAQYRHGNGDFLSINIINRRVQLRFNLGSGICNITSHELLNQFQWHKIKINRHNREASIQIDNGTIVRGTSTPVLTELNLGTPLYVGGIPKDLVMHRLSGIKNHGFVGAIQKLIINGRDLEIAQALFQCSHISNSSSKCHEIVEYNGPPCSRERHPCKNDGSCIPIFDDYTCFCDKYHTGRHCENNIDFLNRPIKFTGHTFLHYRGRRASFTNNTNENWVHDYDSESYDDSEFYEDYSDEQIINEAEATEHPNHWQYLDPSLNGKKNERGNKYEIKLRTYHSNGLVLWRSKNRNIYHYLAVVIVDGYPEFSFNLDSKFNYWSVRFPQRINDGLWHVISVRRQKHVGFISVDGHVAIKGTTKPNVITFNGSPKLWLGGSPNLPVNLPSAYHQGFRGCIQSLKVNKKYLDLMKSSNSLLQFCHENEI